jgi:putative spermidine/putrescine transport system substrate-binding protein
MALPIAAIALAVLAAGCGSGLSDVTSPPAPSASRAASSGSSAQPLTGTAEGFLEAARSEGSLSVIGLSRSSCNYGEIIDAFEQRFGLAVNELDPVASPAEQLQAITDNLDGGPEAPDVVDLSIDLAQQADGAELLARYSVSTRDSIPSEVRDRDGAWTGAYYGVISFEVNATRVPVVPGTWADLLEPRYAGQIALAGDPRESSDASLAVFAAALASGGTLDDIQTGLDFFKQLDTAGNLVPLVATAETIDDGSTPVTIRWTYDSLSHRDAAAGDPKIEVTVPTTGRLAVANAQAINARAPHPNAARLWLEFVLSDEGQNLLLDGYCHPIRFDDLLARNAIPVETLAKLPDTSSVVFPTVAQQTRATDLIAATWDAVVGVDIR